MTGLEAVLDQLAELVVAKLEQRRLTGAPPVEMVTPREFARQHAIAVTTVRAMIRAGRLQATQIGQRQWRVRRDAQIGAAASGRAAAGETAAARARRILGGGR